MPASALIAETIFLATAIASCGPKCDSIRNLDMFMSWTQMRYCCGHSFTLAYLAWHIQLEVAARMSLSFLYFSYMFLFQLKDLSQDDLIELLSLMEAELQAKDVLLKAILVSVT